MFVPTYHHLIQLKYKFVCEYSIPKQDKRLQQLKSDFCREILPVFDRLEGGEESKLKGEVLQELARAEMNLLGLYFSQKSISKEDYMKQVKPYVALQMKALKMIKTFSV